MPPADKKYFTGNIFMSKLNEMGYTIKQESFHSASGGPMSAGTHNSGSGIVSQEWGIINDNWNDQFKWEYGAMKYYDDGTLKGYICSLRFNQDSETMHYSVEINGVHKKFVVEWAVVDAAYVGKKAATDLMMIKMAGIVDPKLSQGLANFFVDYSAKIMYETPSAAHLHHNYIINFDFRGDYIAVPKATTNNAEPPPEFFKTFPFLQEESYHPVTGERQRIKHIIISLNDRWGYSIEQIADWVDELKAQGYDTTAQVEIGENE